MAPNDMPEEKSTTEALVLSVEQKVQLHSFFNNGQDHTPEDVRNWFRSIMSEDMDPAARASLRGSIQKEIEKSDMWDENKKFYITLLNDIK